MNNCAHWMQKALSFMQVDTIFGYPGGAIMPVYDALYESPIKHILCRHEQGCGFAAIGYARSSGRVGVCLATSGPGATNLITPLADALLDSIPVVAITGQVANDFIGTDAFQEIDVLGLSLSVVKHSFLVKTAFELPSILAQAFILAQTGRPGPVLIDIPKDVQLASADKLIAPELWFESFQDEIHEIKHAEQQFAAETFEQESQEAVVALKQAKAPVLYVGGGVGMAGVVTELRQLASYLKIPVVSTLKGLGSIESDARYNLGMLGMHGWPVANLAVQYCDLLIAVGARFDDRVTGQLELFAPKAGVIHFDIDLAEIDKRREVQHFLRGDLKHTLPAFFEAVKEAKVQSVQFKSWTDKVELASEKSKNFAYDKAEVVPQLIAPIEPVSFLHCLQKALPKQSVVSCDVGQHQMWVAQHLLFDMPQDHLSSGGLGTMGFGLPAAVGAQLARPHDVVVAVSGDGSIMMNIQELATLNRYQLPVKIVIFDNQRLGMVKQWQSLFFEQRYSETNLSDNPDFVALANACQIAGQRIELHSQVEQGLADMMQHSGPYLLHVVIPERANVWPLVPPGKSNSDMIYDDSVDERPATPCFLEEVGLAEIGLEKSGLQKVDLEESGSKPSYFEESTVDKPFGQQANSQEKCSQEEQDNASSE
jgi:acetolactate synthase I/II/III large subunit